MNATPFLHTDSEQHNLALLQALYEQQASFTAYAQSINELFYYYVQHCSSQGDDFFLTPTDVHRVLEVVTLLHQLKEVSVDQQNV
ncbi:hypothetical protein [Myroides sp. DF42-4-2]|uniref:hypothetical protein n=1 Tax=Myroides sp. DF42-4-2 TaxID=2746726 RepID=UPI00257710BD|nr:hypothetical protein [Myroides sp. DF42-4-2]MDM1408190.1 hypothetical protein [Myroides sp. DF42-4-2]